jgi:hypothetical protein
VPLTGCYAVVPTAASLFLSALTVQDHLKSRLHEGGRDSGGELVAHLRPLETAA